MRWEANKRLCTVVFHLTFRINQLINFESKEDSRGGQEVKTGSEYSCLNNHGCWYDETKQRSQKPELVVGESDFDSGFEHVAFKVLMGPLGRENQKATEDESLEFGEERLERWVEGSQWKQGER